MITDFESVCVICGRTATNTHHLVYGLGMRKLADQDGLTAPLCTECHKAVHEIPRLGTMSKIIGQLQFEKDQVQKGEKSPREKFRIRYGRSYL